MSENETLLNDIFARIQAMDTRMSEAAIRTLITSILGEPDFVRRFQPPAPDARLAGSKFGRWGLSLADIEFLFDLQESLRNQRRVTLGGVYEGPSAELRSVFEALSAAYYVPQERVRELDKRAIDDAFPRIPLSWLHGPDRALQSAGRWQETQAYQHAQRAMDSAESGFGSQLIGAQYVGDLWAAARPASRIMALLESFEMTAPTAYLPVEVGLPEMLFVAESTAYNSSNYSTSKTGSQRVGVTAYKFVIHQMWSGELEEDAILPFVPFLRRQAEKSLAHYGDSLVVNGDTTNAGTGNINLDDADPADTKHYLALDGLRHVGLVDNTANQKDAGGALTFDMLIKARGRLRDTTNLVDWGHPDDPADLVYAADPDTCDAIALFDEFITVDKMGLAATVLTGQQGKIGQHPLISSVAVPLTEADGKVSTTAGNNTKGQVVPFNRKAFTMGWRRRVKLETERLAGSDQSRLVYSLRCGMGRYSPTGAASGIEAADVIFNITL